MILPDGDWPIVGAFAGGGVLEGELMADADTIMASARKAGFGSVLVRLESPAAFDTFQRWLASNPALGVIAEKQSDYLFRKAAGYASYMNTMAWIVGEIMSLGALLGSIHILYAAVAARTRDMATLRALGYEAVPVAGRLCSSRFCRLSVPSWVSASHGYSFDGRPTVTMESVHELSAFRRKLMALGLAWALVLALLGSLFPALRAARLPVAHALQCNLTSFPRGAQSPGRISFAFWHFPDVHRARDPSVSSRSRYVPAIREYGRQNPSPKLLAISTASCTCSASGQAPCSTPSPCATCRVR